MTFLYSNNKFTMVSGLLKIDSIGVKTMTEVTTILEPLSVTVAT